jgi:hypothetical protein
VEELAPILNGRRLEYIDSDGRRDQLLVKDGKFAGFAPCPRRGRNELPLDQLPGVDQPGTQSTLRGPR